MPGLFSKIIHNAADAVDYHAAYMEDGRTGRRDKLGRKTDTWYEEEKRRERRGHGHRSHRRHRSRSRSRGGGGGGGGGGGERREGARGEGRGGEAAGPAEEGGDRGIPAEGVAAGEGAPPAEGATPPTNTETRERTHHRRHRRHRSRSRSRSHRRHRHRNSDETAEILEPAQGPLGRELPPDAGGGERGGGGGHRERGGEGERGRQRSKWVNKKTGESMSPPRVEMRDWLKKVLKRPPYHRGGERGLEEGGRGPPPQNPIQHQGNRRQSAPGHPYIDDEESQPGHPYVDNEPQATAGAKEEAVDEDVAPPYRETEEQHSAAVEAREVAQQVEEDARVPEEGHHTTTDPAEVPPQIGGETHVEPVLEMPEPGHTEHHEEPVTAAEIPISMPDPEDFGSGASAPPAAASHRVDHHETRTRTPSRESDLEDGRSDISPMPSDDESEGSFSGASTKATTAPSHEPHRPRMRAKGLAGGRHGVEEDEYTDEEDLGSSSKRPATTLKDVAKSAEPIVKKVARGVLKDDDEDSNSSSKSLRAGLKNTAKTAGKGAVGAFLDNDGDDESGPSTGKGRKNKKDNHEPGLRGGGSGFDDADFNEEYEPDEESDEDVEEQHRNEQRGTSPVREQHRNEQRGTSPVREQEPISGTDHLDFFSLPSRGQRANHAASPFSRQPQGQRASDMDFDYQPPLGARPFGTTAGRFAAGSSTAQAFRFPTSSLSSRGFTGAGFGSTRATPRSSRDKQNEDSVSSKQEDEAKNGSESKAPPKGPKVQIVYVDESDDSPASSSSESDRRGRRGRTPPRKSKGQESRRQKAPPIPHPPTEPRPENYYAILEINRDSTQEEIKQASKKMRIQVHPDRNLPNAKSDAERAKINGRAAAVGQASEMLGDAAKRRYHDAEVRAWKKYDAEVEEWEELYGRGRKR